MSLVNIVKNAFISSALAVSLVSPLKADNAIVNGAFVDKKSNPVVEAVVSFERNGLIVDSDITSSDGGFSLEVPVLGLEDDFVPDDFSLAHNYPNPFNPGTKIQLSVDDKSVFSVYDILGRVVDRVNIPSVGNYEVSWGGKNSVGKGVSSGVYIYQLKSDCKVESGKMVKLDGGGSYGLNISKSGYSPKVLSRVVDNADSVRFVHDNTSNLIIPFSLNNDTSFVQTGNIGPSILGGVEDVVLSVGDTLSLNLNNYVYNDDNSLFLPRDSSFVVNDSLLSYVALSPDTFETIVDVVDGFDSSLFDSLGFNVYIPYVLVNSAPEISIPSLSLDEDSSVDVLIGDLNDYAVDVDGDSLSFEVVSQGNPSLVNLILSSNQLLVDSLRTDGYGGSLVGVSVSDGLLSDTSYFNLAVNPVADVLFVLKDYYTDSTLVSDTSTFWIDDSVFHSFDGTLRKQLLPGGYEFNASNPLAYNPGDIGGWYPFNHYTFLRRPGDTENFEQRDHDDTSSVVMFNTLDDTVYAYKIMDDVPLYDVSLIIVGDPQGTVRFGADDLNAPAWWDLNHIAPDSTRSAWTHQLIDSLNVIPHMDKLNLQYIESTELPSVPYLRIAIDPSYPGMGTNSTVYENDTNEIIVANARYPPSLSNKHTFYIEIVQAIGNLQDIGGQDPSIIHPNQEGTELIINDLGKKCLSLLYFIQPMTKI